MSLMSFKFPIVTQPPRNFAFLDELNRIINKDFRELVVVSPFVDAFIIRNIMRRCIFRDRVVTVVTRYSTLRDDEKANVRKAIDEISKFEPRDPGLRAKVTWHENPRLHAKFVLRDWEEILFGSQNFVKQGGLTRNFELGALVEGKDHAADLRPFVESLLRASRRKLYPRA